MGRAETGASPYPVCPAHAADGSRRRMGGNRSGVRARGVKVGIWFVYEKSEGFRIPFIAVRATETGTLYHACVEGTAEAAKDFAPGGGVGGSALGHCGDVFAYGEIWKVGKGSRAFVVQELHVYGIGEVQLGYGYFAIRVLGGIWLG